VRGRTQRRNPRMPDRTEGLLLSLLVPVFFLQSIPGYVLAKRRSIVFRSIGWTSGREGVSA